MLLKKKIFKNQDLINFITDSSNFKIILIFTIITAIYGAYIIGNGIKSFFEVIIYSHTNEYYNIMFFAVLAINTINTARLFIKNNDYIIRLKNRKNYLKELIKIVVEVNILLLTIGLLIFFSILILTKFEYIKTNEYLNYGITDVSYSVFYLLRYYIYAIIFSIINTLIYERSGEYKTIIVDFIFIIFFGLNMQYVAINSKFTLLPWSYFTIKNYGGFSSEIMMSLFFLIIIQVVTILLFKLTTNRKKVFNKYLIYNDLNYLLKKQVKILLLIIIVTMISTIINLNKDLSGLTIISNTLGLTFKLDELNTVTILMYFFNVISFIYLIFYSYIKDYQTNLDQIYLRKGFRDFYIPKTLLLLIIIFVLKIMQYFFTAAILLINKYSIDFASLSNLFITDYLYILMITQLAMAIYLSLSVFKKVRFLTILLSTIAIINIPVTVFALQKYKNIILLISALVIIYNNYLNINHHKKIICEVGGK